MSTNTNPNTNEITINDKIGAIQVLGCIILVASLTKAMWPHFDNAIMCILVAIGVSVVGLFVLAVPFSVLSVSKTMSVLYDIFFTVVVYGLSILFLFS